ncbi:acetylglutamate kinase [Candidatus Karelsulcia muelleri CARI]|uniref:Acetylglutamate kinase n=1 Tax=Karelsulcia muelleri (strain CARI) TaxID=706194 RepID=E0TJH3_KARMC|nr:acetylglutamate kinase [Candidatus Karelsulcia muelleri CARI]
MINVVKIGGEIIDNKKLLIYSLKNFSKLDGSKILVHGGGKIADIFSKKMGYNNNIINGRRITDKTTLDIVVMTYSGLLNKRIVSKLQSLGLNSIGFSGADGNIVKSYKRPIKDIDYGYVGNLNINSINTDLIKYMFKIGIIPVLSPITHDGNGNLLNTNADTIASYLSISLSKEYKVILSYFFNKIGVLNHLNDEKSYYSKIEENLFKKLKNKNIINKGMIPKLENAFYALKNGVYKVTISHPNYLNNPTKKTIICL